jgi:hypothetical protein
LEFPEVLGRRSPRSIQDFGVASAPRRAHCESVAQVSIRSPCAPLGLAKDTVARAVRRLRDLGVVAALQARSESGAFKAGSYRPAVPVACISVVCPSQSSVAASAARSSSACRSAFRSALAALRGLRAPPVFVRRFAPLSFFRQVPARDRVCGSVRQAPQHDQGGCRVRRNALRAEVRVGAVRLGRVSRHRGQRLCGDD